MATKPLPPNQARFVLEYLVDLNATQAAIRAGYSAKTAEQQGSRLLGNAKVRAAVQAGASRRAEKLELKADDVLRELLLIARADIRKAYDEEGKLRPMHEIPEDVARTIAGVEVEEVYEGYGRDRINIGQVVKVKFWSKPQCLELLGKHLKLFVDKMEIHVTSELTDEQRAARAAALLDAGRARRVGQPPRE